jgi:hypothetical protein
MAAAALAGASVASVVVSARADAVPVPWRNCGAPTDPITVQQFDGSVWPPQRGESITVNLRFTVARDIAVGHDELTQSPTTPRRLLRLLAPFRQRTFTAGPHSVSESMRVPLKYQSGSVFSIHLGVFDTAGVRDFCLDLTLPIK